MGASESDHEGFKERVRNMESPVSELHNQAHQGDRA